MQIRTDMAHTSKDGSIKCSSTSYPVRLDDVPYRGLTPVRIGQLQDTPIRLQLLKRSPREILDQKAKIKTTIPTTREGRKLAKSSKTLTDDGCSILDTEEEVLMKLYYLNIIDALIQGVSLDNILHFNEIKESKRLMAELNMKEGNLEIRASRYEESFWRQKAMLEAKRHIYAEDEDLCKGQAVRMSSARALSVPRPSTSRKLRKLDNHQMSKLITMG